MLKYVFLKWAIPGLLLHIFVLLKQFHRIKIADSAGFEHGSPE